MMSDGSPPLLPPSPPPHRPCWGLPLYAVVSRKLPPPTAPSAATCKHAHKGNGATIWWVVQRSLGITAPLSVAVMGGVVVGPHAPSALLLGGLLALMAGLCYCELVTRHSVSDRGNGHLAAEASLYRAMYRLLGELPAYFVAAAWLLCLASVAAACAVALSGTMNFLTGNRLAKALQDHGFVWDTAEGQRPLDVVAAGAGVVTSLLLSFGLEQAWFLRLIMNASSLVVLLLFVSVGGANLPPPEGRPKLHDPSISEVVSSAAVFSVLFLGVYEVSRLSKAKRPNYPAPTLRSRRPLRRVIPLAASLLVAGVVLASFPLGLVLTLITGGGEENSSVIPLLEALHLNSVNWAVVIIGALQVVLLGLALVEGMDAMAKILTELSEDGLMPSVLSLECRYTHASTGAALLTGLLTALPALLLQLGTLLQAGGCGILCVDVVIVFATLYRRHRCGYAPLCSATSPPQTPSLPQTYSVPHTYNLASFREGLQNITVSMTQGTPAEDDGTPLLEIGGGPFDSPRHDPSLGNSVDSTCSGYGSDSENSDIDAAVAWYRERLRVTTRGTAIKPPPTPPSARNALVICVAVTLCLAVDVGLLLYAPMTAVTISCVAVVTLLSLLLLFFLSRLPVLVSPPGVAFSLPASPWVPAAVLLLSLLLLLQLVTRVAAYVAAYFAAALLWYAIFSWWSSNLHKSKSSASSSIPEAVPSVSTIAENSAPIQAADSGSVPTNSGAVQTSAESENPGVLPSLLDHHSPTHEPLSSGNNLAGG